MARVNIWFQKEVCERPNPIGGRGTAPPLAFARSLRFSQGFPSNGRTARRPPAVGRRSMPSWREGCRRGPADDQLSTRRPEALSRMRNSSRSVSSRARSTANWEANAATSSARSRLPSINCHAAAAVPVQGKEFAAVDPHDHRFLVIPRLGESIVFLASAAMPASTILGVSKVTGEELHAFGKALPF